MHPPFSVRDLRRRCTQLGDDLTARDAASAAEVASYLPGGAANAWTGRAGWTYAYGQLNRLAARLERLAVGSDAARALADAQGLAALKGAPVPVPGMRDDAGEPVHVYPKSFDTLQQLHALDAQLGHALAVQQRLLAADAAGLLDAAAANELPTVAQLVSDLTLLCCWVVTTPGPGRPAGADAAVPPIPDALRAWSDVEVLAVVRAHQRLLGRAHVMSALLDERTEAEGGQRPSWSLFLGSLAVELHADPGTLARERTLESLLAQVRLAGAARAVPGGADG